MLLSNKVKYREFLPHMDLYLPKNRCMIGVFQIVLISIFFLKRSLTLDKEMQLLHQYLFLPSRYFRIFDTCYNEYCYYDYYLYHCVARHITAAIKVSTQCLRIKLKSADTRELIYAALVRVFSMKYHLYLRTIWRRRNNVGMNLL